MVVDRFCTTPSGDDVVVVVVVADDAGGVTTGAGGGTVPYSVVVVVSLVAVGPHAAHATIPNAASDIIVNLRCRISLSPTNKTLWILIRAGFSLCVPFLT